MRPRGAHLGLGQGFRNAPLESPVKAGAGLEECSSRELREREEAGWGRAGGMFPQSTPLTLEQQQQRGSTGGRVPPPLQPSGSRMAADQVSVRGSASCRQGFGRPWGAGRGGGRRGWGAGWGEGVGRGGAAAVPFQKTLHRCFVSPATDDGRKETPSSP